MVSDVRLRYLYESARLGTMNAASESLDIATSSVSRQLAQLEMELGLPLIEKGRRRIRLTEAGEAARKYYREKLSPEEAFVSHIDEMKKVRTGKLVLAVGEAFITQSFSDMLDEFMQRYPGMEIRVAISNTTSVSAQIRDAEQEEGVFLEPSLVTNSLTLLKDFVLSGRGISILPELVVHDRLHDGSLCALTSSNAALRGTQTSLITRASRQLPVGAYRLMTCVQSYLRGSASKTGH